MTDLLTLGAVVLLFAIGTVVFVACLQDEAAEALERQEIFDE